MNETVTSLRTHELFVPTGPEAEMVVIKSSDDILFNVHRKNLEVSTGAFPGAEFDTNGDVVQLTETADVLAILFQFIYPKRHPMLEDQNFELVATIAEAAEKYEVFSAMNTSAARLRQFLPDHAVEILAHAIRHDYPKLMNDTAPHIARAPWVAVLEKLPAHGVLPWPPILRNAESVQNMMQDLEILHLAI